MVAASGRLVRIKRGATAIAGARTDNLTINNEPIDITDKDDSGWRTLLAEVGVRSVDCDVEGVLLDSTLIAIAVGTASSILAAHTIEISALGDFTGNFHLSNLAITGEQEGAMTFTASLVSSGAIAFA